MTSYSLSYYKGKENSYMVNHGLAAKLTATDLLLLRSLGRLFSYKKFISSLSARSSNVILTLFEGNPTHARFLTNIMHV